MPGGLIAGTQTGSGAPTTTANRNGTGTPEITTRKLRRGSLVPAGSSVLRVLITQAQAAEILGCHVSLIGKLVARGELTSRGRTGRASLDRDQVLEVLAEREERSRARTPPRRRKGRFEPPDAEHDWLTSVQAAELLGVSVVAVNVRCRRGRLPFVEKAGRRWFRRDHLELVRHADLVKRPAALGQEMALQGQHHEGAGAASVVAPRIERRPDPTRTPPRPSR